MFLIRGWLTPQDVPLADTEGRLDEPQVPPFRASHATLTKSGALGPAEGSPAPGSTRPRVARPAACTGCSSTAFLIERRLSPDTLQEVRRGGEQQTYGVVLQVKPPLWPGSLQSGGAWPASEQPPGGDRGACHAGRGLHDRPTGPRRSPRGQGRAGPEPRAAAVSADAVWQATRPSPPARRA